MRRRISGSIFWGLVFVAFGSLILVRNLGYPIPLWTGFVRYWPVLLIVWGLFKLVDFFGMEADEKRRPLFTGGDIAAIVLVILFGSLITLAANMNPDFGKFLRVGNLDVWDLTGNNFTFTEQHVADAGPRSVIEITGSFADIEILPSDGERITLDVRKTIRAANQTDAERLSSEFVYFLTSSNANEGTKYQIGTNSHRRFKASLTIHVPTQSSVSVENRNGNVSIRGLAGNQEITNRFGDVEVHSIDGMVKVQNQNGSVRVDDISSSVTIANNFAPITVANVRGELKISGRNNVVDIEHVEKDLDVESAYQNIDIRDPLGAVHVRNRNGEISIRLLQPPGANVSISSEYGNVNVEIPASAAFSADVRNRYGSVYSEFSELHTMSQNAEHLLNGQVGIGGPNIRIDSRNGEIRFTKRG